MIGIDVMGWEVAWWDFQTERRYGAMDLLSDSCLGVRLLSLLTVLNHHVCIELLDWFS